MEMKNVKDARLNKVLDLIGLPRSSWYYKPVADEKKKKSKDGRKAKPIDKHIEEAVVSTAMLCPWYGYKKIAVIVRRNGIEVSNRIVYRVMKKHDLLKKRRRSREAALYQASKCSASDGIGKIECSS